MGSGYELSCKKCGFTRDIHLGISFRYPVRCADILEEMKNGAFGKEFMADANSIPHAAVHYEETIFLCDHCGNWKTDMKIDLCAPEGEYRGHKGRFSTAFDYPKDMPYVLKCEMGETYRVVRSKPYRCSKCGHALRTVKKNEKGRCPKCGGALKKSAGILWD